ncbi:hypothetical protein [Pedobacter alluvionis]|uniref:hypothetical protein n=1 Tax=Pedobacter alluvionis TaxID=475253 RepID=UPI00141B3852|nr:hypothetical protein [Pedobacter alluvionis]
MCRIAGIINSKKSFKKVNQKVKAMCDSMQHEGSDDQGIYANSALALHQTYHVS